MRPDLVMSAEDLCVDTVRTLLNLSVNEEKSIIAKEFPAFNVERNPPNPDIFIPLIPEYRSLKKDQITRAISVIRREYDLSFVSRNMRRVGTKYYLVERRVAEPMRIGMLVSIRIGGLPGADAHVEIRNENGMLADFKLSSILLRVEWELAPRNTPVSDEALLSALSEQAKIFCVIDQYIAES